MLGALVCFFDVMPSCFNQLSYFLFCISTSPSPCNYPAGPEYTRWRPHDVQNYSTSQHSLSSSTHSNYQAHRQAFLHPRRLHLPGEAPGVWCLCFTSRLAVLLHHWGEIRFFNNLCELWCKINICRFYKSFCPWQDQHFNFQTITLFIYYTVDGRIGQLIPS